MKTFTVKGLQGGSRILVGETLSNVQAYLPQGTEPVIITDETLYALYKDQFPKGRVLTIGTGEKIKTLATVETLIRKLINLGCDRSSFILGIGGGIVLGAGLIALLELLNSSIRRPADLTNRLGITPFVTIPYIRTRRQRVVRRTLIGMIIAVVTIGIPLGLYLLHTYYLPMDLLIERALDKTGLSGILEKLGLSL